MLKAMWWLFGLTCLSRLSEEVVPEKTAWDDGSFFLTQALGVATLVTLVFVSIDSYQADPRRFTDHLLIFLRVLAAIAEALAESDT